jgi:t-SNARE complex subunit (syntaxin)
VETLKNNQCKINNSISQIKISVGSLENRVEQVKNRQIEELDQRVKDHERMPRKCKWSIEDI